MSARSSKQRRSARRRNEWVEERRQERMQDVRDLFGARAVLRIGDLVITPIDFICWGVTLS